MELSEDQHQALVPPRRSIIRVVVCLEIDAAKGLSHNGPCRYRAFADLLIDWKQIKARTDDGNRI
jgi:hypothetical protein